MTESQIELDDPWPNREREHVEYTNGQTCNCDSCVEKRGYFLCTNPIAPELEHWILHKREKA